MVKSESSLTRWEDAIGTPKLGVLGRIAARCQRQPIRVH